MREAPGCSVRRIQSETGRFRKRHYILELARPQHYERAALDDFDARFLRLRRERAILRAWIHDNATRFCANDFVDERIRSRFAEIKRHGIDRAGRVRNIRITLFAQDFIEGGIDRQRSMPVFEQHLQGLVSVTIRLRRSAEDCHRFD